MRSACFSVWVLSKARWRGLRYRNAVLSEENRRFKLAQTAGEAIRRDLEHDREQLLAAAKQLNLNLLKSSNEQ